jgi:hypothetical protein
LAEVCGEIAMTVWRDVHVGIERDSLKIGGIEVWKHKWRSTGELPLDLPHPSHPNQTHQYDIYEIEDAGNSVRFATSELSNGVWGFYIPE